MSGLARGDAASSSQIFQPSFSASRFEIPGDLPSNQYLDLVIIFIELIEKKNHLHGGNEQKFFVVRLASRNDFYA